MGNYFLDILFCVTFNLKLRLILTFDTTYGTPRSWV